MEISITDKCIKINFMVKDNSLQNKTNKKDYLNMENLFMVLYNS